MEDDKQYRCFCNSMHVKRGAYIIGIVGTLLSVLGLIFSAVMHRWDYVIGNFLYVLLYVTIIYAHKNQDPSLYWPFLVFNGIGIAFITLVLLILGVGFLWSLGPPENAKLPTDQQSNKGTQLGNVTLIAVLSICLFIGVWFQCVVYRACKYMEMNESSIPTTNIKTKIHKQDG
ncbi:hypothetical protein Ddc_16210 [Ditylenchus destructor]|nr:hypothetical protein Ddc_16210 [Ditylenchus destructor]